MAHIEAIQNISNRILSKKQSTFRRYLFDTIGKDSKLIGIIGARGAGKTTLMLQLAKSAGYKTSELLYLSADHPICVGISLFDIADEFARLGGKLLLIDEIHKRPGFDSELKMIYDVLGIMVIFSGSSALEIVHADLSRRALVYRLPILSFREFLQLSLDRSYGAYSIDEIIEKHVEIASYIVGDIAIIKHFRDYLSYGAYPFFIESVSDFLPKLEETLVKVLDEDIPAVFGSDFEMQIKMKLLLKMICKGSPKEINLSKLAKDSGIYREKLYHILYQLKEASLIRMIGSDYSGGKLINKPQKLYLDNASLFPALCYGYDIGNVRETFFASMIESTGLSAEYPIAGDFLVDGKYLFEIGGRNKDFGQIKASDGYVVQDDTEIGNGNKIPLWLFGFLY
jgi:hypothetical protein